MLLPRNLNGQSLCIEPARPQPHRVRARRTAIIVVPATSYASSQPQTHGAGDVALVDRVGVLRARRAAWAALGVQDHLLFVGLFQGTLEGGQVWFGVGLGAVIPRPGTYTV